MTAIEAATGSSCLQAIVRRSAETAREMADVLGMAEVPRHAVSAALCTSDRTDAVRIALPNPKHADDSTRIPDSVGHRGGASFGRIRKALELRGPGHAPGRKPSWRRRTGAAKRHSAMPSGGGILAIL